MGEFLSKNRLCAKWVRSRKEPRRERWAQWHHARPADVTHAGHEKPMRAGAQGFRKELPPRLNIDTCRPITPSRAGHLFHDSAHQGAYFLFRARNGRTAAPTFTRSTRRIRSNQYLTADGGPTPSFWRPLGLHMAKQECAVGIFEDRQRAFERMFVHDEETRFRALARRNKFLGQWAAGQLGLSGQNASDYVEEIRNITVAAQGDEQILRKL